MDKDMTHIPQMSISQHDWSLHRKGPVDQHGQHPAGSARSDDHEIDRLALGERALIHVVAAATAVPVCASYQPNGAV